MTRLYLIRHAEAEGNLYRIAQGQDNSNLTDRGWRQVRALERRFVDIPVDAVYASDLYRTCATASALYQPKGLPLHRRPDLREICVGSWERRTWGDIARESPEQMDAFSHHPERWHVEGAETPEQVLERVLKAIETIAAEQAGKTAAVVSHGYAIRLLLAHLQGIPLEKLGETPTGDNTAVSLLEAEEGVLRVVFRDDNRHLKTPEFLAGEKVRRRANALEPGLWFRPLQLPQQADTLRELLEGREAGFDAERLLSDAAGQMTLVGYLREEPVGVVQLGPEPERICRLWIRPDCRRRGFGTQLIGQAVQNARQSGKERLIAELEEEHPAAGFFADHGFRPAGTLADGRRYLEKNIGFLPEFLSGTL